MNAESFERKLTAILSADVAGYSRLMGEDENLTISTLTGHRSMMTALIKQYKGRVVDSPGDNMLVEFASVLQAVNCAVEIQRELAERNAELPQDRRMAYRIGINLGDVAQEGDRIYGDGVNIAARLESLAEPGGICISGIVYNQVKTKLKLEYEFLGKQTVKNIREPVPVYCIQSLPKAVAIQSSTGQEPISILSGKPSIAVLPFVNMSHDPEQEYFSDGMSEEIIAALAKLEGLKVISRTSAFHFKAKDTDLRTIGEKLKVEHVLEGSVRKAGNKIRITAQLIKVADDTHLWADTFDRELQDVFAIQDEISQAVVENLKVKLFGKRTKPLVKDYTKNIHAHELFLKADYFFHKVELKKAIEYSEKAIQTDPCYVPAYNLLVALYYSIMMRESKPPWEMKPKIDELLQKAIEIDEHYGLAYRSLGRIKMDEYDRIGAEKSYKRAIELNPSSNVTHSGYSEYLMAVGHIHKAILEARYAVELDPLASLERLQLSQWLTIDGQFNEAITISKETLELDPNNLRGLFGLAFAFAGKGIYEEAISILQKEAHIPLGSAHLGWCYGKAGNVQEAQKILNGFLDQYKSGYFSPYFIAIAYAGLGEKDKVFEWLDRAYEVQDPSQAYIKVHYGFTDLHSDPRWQDVLKKRNLAD